QRPLRGDGGRQGAAHLLLAPLGSGTGDAAGGEGEPGAARGPFRKHRPLHGAAPALSDPVEVGPGARSAERAPDLPQIPTEVGTRRLPGGGRAPRPPPAAGGGRLIRGPGGRPPSSHQPGSKSSRRRRRSRPPRRRSPRRSPANPEDTS